MAKGPYWLNDVEWARIEPLLPHGRRGAGRVDDSPAITWQTCGCGGPWRQFCDAIHAGVRGIGKQRNAQASGRTNGGTSSGLKYEKRVNSIR